MEEKYFENLAADMVKQNIIVKGKEVIAACIMRGVYCQGKSDYEKEVREEFRKKMKYLINKI